MNQTSKVYLDGKFVPLIQLADIHLTIKEGESTIQLQQGWDNGLVNKDDLLRLQNENLSFPSSVEISETKCLTQHKP